MTTLEAVASPPVVLDHPLVREAISALRDRGTSAVASCSLLSVIAAPEGVHAVREAYPEVRIWTAALDTGLNEHGFIVPGPGDAGDRLWGTL